ncbi:hypothetical protein HY251_21310 [bacterium]|nr:hypothetical protein [bacterium]
MSARNDTVALFLAATLLCSSAATAQDKTEPAPPPPAVAGAEILTLPGDARGDAASALADLLRAVKETPDEPGSVLADEAVGGYWNLVADGRKKCRSVLEAVAGDSPSSKDGWALERHRAMLQEVRLADGDLIGALALSAQRGYVREWSALGPFGWSSHSILDEAFAPETDARAKTIDAKARYQTTKGETSWAKVPARKLAVDVYYAHALRSTQGAVYLLAHVESPSDMDVVMEYMGGSAKVFVNRGLAATVDRNRHRLDARVRFDAHLRKGWNRIVVKEASFGGSFALRIANKDGSSVLGLGAEKDVVSHDVDAEADATGALRESALVETLRESVEKTTVAVPGTAECLLAYALAQSGRGEEAYEIVEHGKVKQAGDAPIGALLSKSAWFQLLRANVVERADHLIEATRRVELRNALKATLEQDKANAVARRRLAELLLQDDKPKEGLTALEDQLAALPDDAATRVRLYDSLLHLGWEHEAEKVLADLEKLKGSMALLTAKASWIARKGDRLALQKVYEDELSMDARAHWVLSQRRELAIARGDEAAAKKALDAEEEHAPDAEAGAFDRARAELAFAFGHKEEGTELLSKALDARPGDLELRERLARALAVLGTEADERRALALMDDLLTVEPHRWAAQNLRTALRKKVDQFWKEWEFDSATLVPGSPQASAFPKAQTIMLQDQTITRIRRDGSSTEVVHQAWKVFTDQGKEKLGRRPISGDTMAIRVFTPKGEVLEPIRAGGAFEMPGLAPGAVVEHEFLAEHGPHRFQFTNGPWFLRDPDFVEPYVHSRWVVISPKGMNLEVIEKNLDGAGCKKTVQERGDEVVRIWETFDQDRIEPEPHMPRRDELLPWVKLYERRSQEEIAGFYLDRAVGQAYVTPTIQAKADELTKKLESDEAKLKAIVAFAKEHVKEPYDGGQTASQVLAAKAGSKTTLVMALLDAAGVPYRFALAGSSPDFESSTDWAHPEPNQFHTHILRVEPRGGTPLWVMPDGPRYCPIDMLPTYLWGAPVPPRAQGRRGRAGRRRWPPHALARVRSLAAQAEVGRALDAEVRPRDQRLPGRRARHGERGPRSLRGARSASGHAPELALRPVLARLREGRSEAQDRALAGAVPAARAAVRVQGVPRLPRQGRRGRAAPARRRAPRGEAG